MKPKLNQLRSGNNPPMKHKKKLDNKTRDKLIALNSRVIKELSQRIILLEEVIYKYIEMNKNTKKFNKYLQDEILKDGADEKQKRS